MIVGVNFIPMGIKILEIDICFNLLLFPLKIEIEKKLHWYNVEIIKNYGL